MQIISQEEARKIKEGLKSAGKSGSRKEAKKLIAELVKANKGKSFVVKPDDIKPNFAEGFTEGLGEDIAQSLKVSVTLMEKVMIERVIKGEKTEVPRYSAMLIEA